MNWRCPYCNHDMVVQNHNKHDFATEFIPNKKVGQLYLAGHLIFCANVECNNYALTVAITKGATQQYRSAQNQILTKWVNSGQEVHSWQLLPESTAKPVPTYIPVPIAQDYTEACRIQQLSPKASATLARRCLQGIIRDFWGVSKPTLKHEIDAIQGQIDSDTWDAIDAVRKIGNIGAHMEKDINVIVDVEPEEAQLLVGLIETLFDEWYIARHERQLRMAKVKALAAEKEADRAAATTPPTP